MGTSKVSLALSTDTDLNKGRKIKDLKDIKMFNIADRTKMSSIVLKAGPCLGRCHSTSPLVILEYIRPMVWNLLKLFYYS